MGYEFCMKSLVILSVVSIVFSTPQNNKQITRSQHVNRGTKDSNFCKAEDEKAKAYGMIQMEGKNSSNFYYFSTNKKTWNDSRQDCKRMDTEFDLVSIESDEENAFIFNQTLQSKVFQNSFWIGGFYKKTDWIWISSGKQFSLKKWALQYPNFQRNDNEYCVYFSSSRNTKFYHGTANWYNSNCEITRNYICQMQLSKKCKNYLNPNNLSNNASEISTISIFVFLTSIVYNLGKMI